MSSLLSILERLRKLKPEVVKRYHVSSIGLFGSIVRQDFRKEESDIDVIVEFSEPVGVEFIDLADFLESELEQKVDLVSRKAISAPFFREIEMDIVYV